MMNINTLRRIDNVLEVINKGNVYLLTVVCFVIGLPFFLMSEGVKYIYHRAKGMIYVPNSFESWITKEEYEHRLYMRRMENREIPLPVENHVLTDKNDRFMFFRKRKLKIPHNQLVYVETDYNEEMHRFFDENAEWLEAWQRWHGWEIAYYDAEDIKEGMFYPQDYAVFKHGFLRNPGYSSGDRESKAFGDIHYYYEIDADSDVSIKDQMEDLTRKIYASMNS